MTGISHILIFQSWPIYVANKSFTYRFYEREVNLGCKILKKVRSELKDVMLICKNEKKQTNDHREIISDLNRGIIPKNWTLYKIPPNTTVIQWINDFSMRVKQLEEISKVIDTYFGKLLLAGFLI